MANPIDEKNDPRGLALEAFISTLEPEKRSAILQAMARGEDVTMMAFNYAWDRSQRAALQFDRPRGQVVTQAWTHGISMMQQTVLLTAIRGPDGLAKYGGGAKMLLRWYRRCVLLSAMDGRVLVDPIEPNGGSFTGPSLEGSDDQDPWEERMQVHVNDYLRQVDALPHHYQMHFMHAAEIVGYKHPDTRIRFFWHQVYVRLANDFHLWPETEAQLDERLGDTREGWLKRADPATAL